jgi:hypothetical protein
MDAFYLKPKRYIRSADPIDTSLVTPTKADLKTGITKANTPRPTTQASKQSHHNPIITKPPLYPLPKLPLILQQLPVLRLLSQQLLILAECL